MNSMTEPGSGGGGLFPEPARLTTTRSTQPRPATDVARPSEALVYQTRAAATVGHRAPRWHFSRNGYAACGGYILALDTAHRPSGIPASQRCRAQGCAHRWENPTRQAGDLVDDDTPPDNDVPAATQATLNRMARRLDEQERADDHGPTEGKRQ